MTVTPPCFEIVLRKKNISFSLGAWENVAGRAYVHTHALTSQQVERRNRILQFLPYRAPEAVLAGAVA